MAGREPEFLIPLWLVHGKSAQTDHLSTAFRDQDILCHLVRFGGQAPAGEACGRLISSECLHDPIDLPMTQQSWPFRLGCSRGWQSMADQTCARSGKHIETALA